MLILAIESTTEACSVALYKQGDIVELFDIAPRQHTNLLLNRVDSLLKQNDVSKQSLDAIAYCRGPGAFTGLRITTGVAQGLAFGLNIPLIAISSLAALTQGAYRINQKNNATNKLFNYLPCLDARKSEVFWGFYTVKDGYASAINDEQVSSVEALSNAISQYQPASQKWQVVGTASEIIKKINEPSLIYVDSSLETINYPQAYDVAFLAAKEFELGNTIDVEQAVPVYLRNNVTF